MRFIIGTVVFAGISAIALADPPSPTPTQSSTPTSTAAPSASPQQTTTMDLREKMLKSKGYHLEMQHGEKMYCRTEEVMGSRLGGKKTCGTVEQLEDREHRSKEMAESAQRSQLNPTGK
jgi:hypothetical protein